MDSRIGVVPKEHVAPILFYKVGIPGSAPAHALESMARELGAEYLSSKEVRAKLARDKAKDRTRPQAVRNISAKRVLSRHALNIMRQGKDVVLDAFYNTDKTRKEPSEIALWAGGITVALFFDTPMRVALRRTRESNSNTGPEQISYETLEARTRDALKILEIPTSHQRGVDHAFKIDGTSNSDGVLMQVMGHLYASGLGARYERREDK